MKKIFIGSSSKKAAMEKMHNIHSILEKLGAQVTCWPDAFTLSENTIDELIKAAHEYDAAVFIFDKDDLITDTSHGSVHYIPRDNVIAEAGMFISALGKESVVLCTTPGVHEISDFKGVTTLIYKRNNLDDIEKQLDIWLKTKVPENNSIAHKSNVLMLPRKKIHELYSIDSRLHITDGSYRQISHVRIMNLASNLIINPAIGEIGHIPTADIPLSDAIKKIMEETSASVDLMLTQPNHCNIKDAESKIANQRAGSGAEAVYSAWKTLYSNLSTDTVYAKRSSENPILFHLYAMKISMPFGIFNVEFCGEAKMFKLDYEEFLEDETDEKIYLEHFQEIHDSLRQHMEAVGRKKQLPKLCLPKGQDFFRYRKAGMSLGDVHMVITAFYMQIPIILSDDSDIDILRGIVKRRISSDNYDLMIFSCVEVLKQIAALKESNFTKEELLEVLKATGENKSKNIVK